MLFKPCDVEIDRPRTRNNSPNVFIRWERFDAQNKNDSRGTLGGDDGEEGPPADRPERRVDHPQGHHAEDPGDPAATPGPRRVLGRRRVRGVLPPEEERIGSYVTAGFRR